MNDLEALKSELAKAHEACARWRQAAELATQIAEAANERAAQHLALAQAAALQLSEARAELARYRRHADAVAEKAGL